MELLNTIRDWFIEHPTALNVAKYLIWLFCILIVLQFIKRQLRKNVAHTPARYKSQKIIEIVGYILVFLMTISYFTGNIKDFTLAIGLLTAGITITLQELVLSLAGSVFIFFVKVYKPGDRIEINGIKGDVIDIDSLYTTMMEIGQWVTSDNYSGRIVKLSNAFVFKGPVYNYSQDFPFICDEFNLPIRYGSDIELAKTIVSIADDLDQDDDLLVYLDNPTITFEDITNSPNGNLKTLFDTTGLSPALYDQLFNLIQNEICALSYLELD